LLDPLVDALPLAVRVAILEAFVETSQDAVFSQDRRWRINSWNRSSERVFGYPEEEILGQRGLVLFPEHLRAEVQLVFDAAAAGDRLDRYETEARRRDGLPVPISLSLCPVFSRPGDLTAVLIIARDVTEQRLAQATLAEIESRMRQAEALAHVGSWLWDIRTGTVQWTDELHRIHAVDPVDFEGTLDAHLDRIHPEDQSRVWRGLTAAVASGRSFEDEYRIVHPDGGHRWVYARAEPTVGSAGDVVGLHGIAQDVTEHKR
jgi:PAS domain S-box-containing protein